MTIVNISVGQVVEMLEMTTMSIEAIVYSFYLNDRTIVHCMDNNTDYPGNEANLLIAYMNDQINN